MKGYITPAIAIPHRMPAQIWWERPESDPESDGHDLHSILESREEAEAHVRLRRHQWTKVEVLIDEAWPQ